MCWASRSRTDESVRACFVREVGSGRRLWSCTRNGIGGGGDERIGVKRGRKDLLAGTVAT